MPIASASVRFFELTTEFGPKGQLIPLGSAITDRNGAAQLTAQPTVTGVSRFVATYIAAPKAAPASASVDVFVTTARSKYRPAPTRPFAGIGNALVGVLLATAALVLLTLAVQVERVRRACRASG